MAKRRHSLVMIMLLFGAQAAVAATGVFRETVIPSSTGGATEMVPFGHETWYFTEFDANRIGMLTLAGQFREFLVPTPDAGPRGIALGSVTKAVWFTEKSAGQIGFLSPNGPITEYPLTDRSSQPTAITLSVFGAVFLESGGTRIVEIKPDAVMVPGIGTSGHWESEIEVANPGTRSADILAGVYLRYSCISLGYTPPATSIELPPNGSGKMLVNTSVIFGPGNFYVRNTVEGILPAVRARIYNRDAPSQSADLPAIRLSTLTKLNPTTLTFPGAVRSGPDRTNLLIAELSIDRLIVETPIPSIRTRVEVLGSDGTLLGSEEFDVTSGTDLYLVDVIGRLGIASLQDGQVRVTKVGGEGLLWGYLA